MSALYSCQVERRNFGDLMSVDGVSRLDIRSSSDLDQLLQQYSPSQSVLAVWSCNPRESGQLPELLICPDGAETDWAAWITTFGARIRPFSAYMRLVSYAQSQRIANAWRTPELDRLTWPIVGLVLGEVLAASRFPDKALESIPAVACASTLSFAMFRAAATYSRFEEWPQLVTSWDFVRDATRQRARAIESALVARVCATIIDAAGLHDADNLLSQDDINVRIACHDLLTSPERAPSVLVRIPLFVAIEEKMHGSREDRVVAFDHFVRSLSEMPKIDPELMSLILGYLASRIAPGTMRHSAVLGTVVDRYPGALLWYGFCAGLGGPDSSPMKITSGRRAGIDLPASARRVARDLLRPEPIIGPPSCDIALLELLALSRTGRDPLEGLVTTTPTTASVELVPGVWMAVNTPSKSSQSEGTARPLRDKEILMEMGEHIERLRGAFHELVVGEFPGDEGRQRSLFGSKRKRK